MTQHEITTLRDRMTALIGSRRWQTAFAVGLGKAVPVVCAWFSDAPKSQARHPGPEFAVIVELLEIVPVERWPERWVKLAALKTQQSPK